MAGTKGRVADAAHGCIASFDAIDQVFLPEAEPSTTASGWSRNEDGRSRFQIWMSNLGAAHPATDRRSADYRLREAPEVVDRIVELLEELTEINGEALEIVSGERSNRQITEDDSDTDNSSPGSSQDELSELFLSTGDVLTSLFKVSMLVKKATTRDRYARAASAKDKPYLIEFDIRHVADKFPKAREQPWLLERLGAAITQRRQFLRYCRNHKNRIAHVSSSDTAILGPNEDALRHLHHDGKLGLPAHDTYVASSTKTPMTRPTLSPTAASTLQPDKIAREDLQDLDDNDDAVSQSTSVAYSQATGEGSGHLRFVRLQDLSHDHEPFECPYCYSIVQARRQRSWRKHVLSDLRAYVCMFEGCDAGLFEDKAAWARHDAEEHRRQWDCQHCQHTCRPFSSSHGLLEHMRFYHAGDGLPAEVLTQVVKASSRPLSETAPDCPLCDFDIEVCRQADRTGQAVPSSSQVVIPLAELQKHLALHQEQLALFAIPPTIERGVESESRHGKSQVGPDEQIKMMADWQDHLSELDATDDLEQLPNSELNIDSAAEFEERSPSPLSETPSRENVPAELPGFVPALDEPQELESPSIVPGDIVYIRRQTGEQLTYSKAVYLGDPGGGQHIARNWDTKNDLKVSFSELVRKENVTEDERVEAESIKAYVAIQDSETLSKSRFYLKHATLPPEIKAPFITRMNKLATGDEWLTGYDRAMVQKVCSTFLKYETQIMGRSVRVEELVRMFYASAVTAAPGSKKSAKKDGPSSDNARQAGIKRHAALLTDVLIGVIDEASEQVFPERDIVSAQLREEYSGMLSRANSTVKDDAGSTHRDQLKATELSPQFLEALKSRLAIVAQGEETAVTLPKFGAHLMRQASSSFLFRLQSTYPGDRAILLETVLGEFLACAETEIRHDRAGSNKEGRSVAAERLVALLLSLLISIDAALELERLNDVQPRIRNQFTAVLMEERSRYLSQASEIEERLFRVSQRSKPEFDIHFFTEKSRREHDKRYGEMIASDNNDPNDIEDPSQPKYCYCLRGSHGVMVACDGPNCRRKWFHLSCTDLKKPLNDYNTWFCVFCQPPMKTATGDTQESSATATIDASDKEPELNETQESETAANERPPRGMVCKNCKFVWRSASASELRDCPNCGSYSVFAESPPRTTSPEATGSTLRPDATGEEAIGQYFSERTNKFMSLYRRETLAEESKPEQPRENFPDPWSHLHTSSSANSPRLEESPPAVPKDPLPEVDASENTASDGNVPVAFTDSSAVEQIKLTIRYIQETRIKLNERIALSNDASSVSTPSVEEMGAVSGQLRSLAVALTTLLPRQKDCFQHSVQLERYLKLCSLSSSLSTLCWSILNTLDGVFSVLDSSEAKEWNEMVRKMEDSENVHCLKKLQWYQDLTMVLCGLVEGHTDENLMTDKLRLEENISSLLRVQDTDRSQIRQEVEAAFTTAGESAIERPDVGASDAPESLLEDPVSASQGGGRASQKEPAVISAGSSNPSRLGESPPTLSKDPLPEIGSSEDTGSDGNAPVAIPGLSTTLSTLPRLQENINTPDNTTGDTSTPVVYPDSTAVRLLKRMLDQINQIERAVFDEAHVSRIENFTGVQEIRDFGNELHKIDTSLKRLFQRERRDTECRTKLMGSGSIVSTFCSSVQITLHDFCIVFASNDLVQWADTVRSMEDVELVGWRQRMKLYQDILTNLTEARGRDSEYWLKRLDADVLELLGLQESNSLQAAKRRRVTWPQVEIVEAEGNSDGQLVSAHREPQEIETTSSDRGRGLQDNHEVASAGSAVLLPEGRVSAPSPLSPSPLSPSEGENEATILSGDLAARLVPYAGSLKDEREETVISEDPISATHDRGRESQKGPAITSAGSANQRPPHRRPERTLHAGSDNEEEEATTLPADTASALEKIGSLREVLHRLEKNASTFEQMPPAKPSELHAEVKRLKGSLLELLLKVGDVETEDGPEADAKKGDLTKEAREILTRVNDASSIARKQPAVSTILEEPSSNPSDRGRARQKKPTSPASNDSFDSPQDLNRHTLTQEQFNTMQQTGLQLSEAGDLNLDMDSDVFSKMFPDYSHQDTKSQNTYDFPDLPVPAPPRSAEPSTMGFPSSGTMQSRSVATSSEDSASAVHDRDREGQNDSVVLEGSTNSRRPAHRRRERIPFDAPEEQEDPFLSGQLAGTSHDHGQGSRMEPARQTPERTLYGAPIEEGVEGNERHDTDADADAGPDDMSKAPIRFKDAVGRKFSFPWHMCKTWKGMESLIKQAFLHVDVIGAHVQEGHYDLMGPEGELILPQVWDAMVKPGWEVSMHMWPIPEMPKKKGKEKKEEFEHWLATGDPVRPKPKKVSGIAAWMAGGSPNDPSYQGRPRRDKATVIPAESANRTTDTQHAYSARQAVPTMSSRDFSDQFTEHADPVTLARRSSVTVRSNAREALDDGLARQSRPPRQASATGTRSASRSGSHGRIFVPQVQVYDRNNPLRVRERWRRVVNKRERWSVAAEELDRLTQGTAADVGIEPSGRWEPVSDEVEERISGREYYYVSEGPAREEARRRHGSWQEEMGKSPSVTNSDNNNRRHSDLVGERGREIIERERARAAAAELQKAAEEGTAADAGVGDGPSPRHREPVFDGVGERPIGEERRDASEGPTPSGQEDGSKHRFWWV